MDRHARRIRDHFLTAAGLLTRLPLPRHEASGTGAAWAWPVVGLGLGALAGLAGWVALSLGLPAPVAAVAVLAVQVVLTGGLHEDGLADTADGLWGGWTRERRLEIMRDSRIGSYGVIALILGFSARWTALAVMLDEGGYWGALIAAAALSRGVLPAIMALVPNARTDGLSRGVGRPSGQIAALAAMLALVVGVLAVGTGVIAAALAAALAALGLAAMASRRIGGQTGDILGAIQVLAEIAVLLTLV
ncbi:putative Cobalamin (5'-phosphate) synthase [Pseudooceanicola batsensis HTCC2597]|uniref:Adenosylcobinamide-GDP ribazoletransferase n=1 Tax=Pseudooceanicola batsensis (strain ATCC BAA-863 / DSM 15984 / KCTC 12145 / HTCC2597) TaxID=252305 RepID=A3TX21_PSEBH|nr:adenosylcobinamide-GDP ribazoletransferase [Pseudooceanicola batsensis]EAQ03381.1 putative Cobalamin (5'-phosphate) synthase [Pseudooceanicola batsensis HTCC2597]